MIPRDEILAYLNALLRPERFQDACPNGIQVFGGGEIGLVASCTSVSEEFFARAKDAGAQLLLVHHGLFWEQSSRVIDPVMGRRLGILLSNGLNLVAYHLPLDAHPTLGNNARLAALLELGDLDWGFGHYHGVDIGCTGQLREPLPLAELVARLQAGLATTPQVFASGPSRVRRVGVVSGGAGDTPFLLEAIGRGCDVYVTGTITEPGVALAREGGLNVLVAGHYNSEKLGVRALGDALHAHFGIEVVHLDIPNPI